VSWFSAARVLRARAQHLRSLGVQQEADDADAVEDALAIFAPEALASWRRACAVVELEAMAAEFERRGRDETTAP